MLCSRNQPELQDTVTAIQERGGKAWSVVADVAKPDEVERLAAVAIEEFGAIDYSASKHAVKGFTDALRMELEATRAGVRP